MRRNKTLLHLAHVLENCNVQDLTCERVFVYCSMCVNELADDAIGLVQRLLDKPEIRSCRIPLVIDFEQMTDVDYWLKSKLFSVAPVARSEPLRQKIVQLVDMLNALQIKVLQVDADYAGLFFKRMAARLKKSTHNLEYELWRVQHEHPTMEELRQQQTRQTAKVLIAGVLFHAADPSGSEIRAVRRDLVENDLDYNMELPDDFTAECAKLRRYSYWKEGILFMIDYHGIYSYLFSHCFEKFTKEQRIALYEYDVQLKMIHEDMARLRPELGKYLYDSKRLVSLENTKLFAPYFHIKEMLKDDWFMKNRADRKYDGNWADAFADALMRSEYGCLIADDWKEKGFKIKGYVIGCLKEAGVFKANVSNDSLAKDAAIISNTRTFGKYIGADSKRQPYAEWIRKHVDDYCK